MFDQNQLAQIQGWTAIVQAISAVVIGVAAAAISIVSYRETQRWSKRNFEQELSHAWMQVDGVALSNDDLLRVAESVMYPGTSPDVSVTDIQKRWFSYMMLNPLVVTWRGKGDKVFSDAEHPAFERELTSMLRDPVVFAVTQEGIYGDPSDRKSFAHLCARLREKVASSHPG